MDRENKHQSQQNLMSQVSKKMFQQHIKDIRVQEMDKDIDQMIPVRLESPQEIIKRERQHKERTVHTPVNRTTGNVSLKKTGNKPGLFYVIIPGDHMLVIKHENIRQAAYIRCKHNQAQNNDRPQISFVNRRGKFHRSLNKKKGGYNPPFLVMLNTRRKQDYGGVHAVSTLTTPVPEV
jgi:hypothetical protein